MRPSLSLNFEVDTGVSAPSLHGLQARHADPQAAWHAMEHDTGPAAVLTCSERVLEADTACRAASTLPTAPWIASTGYRLATRRSTCTKHNHTSSHRYVKHMCVGVICLTGLSDILAVIGKAQQLVPVL